MKVLISVVICSYNRRKFLLQTVKGFVEDDFSNDLYEIVIVDNNSSDGSLEYVQRYIDELQLENVKIVSEINQGLSFARNRGIQESTGELIAFVDDDARPVKGYLFKLKTHAERLNSICCFGGKVVPEFEVYPNWLSTWLEPLFAVQDYGDQVNDFPKSKFPIGANMIFRRKVFDEIGLFNTELGRKGEFLGAGEEKDIFYRMLEHGYKASYLPDVEVIHSIPEKRISKDYIKRQAQNGAATEMVRAKTLSKKIIILLAEMIKWGGSIVLCIGYLFKMEIPKGLMLLRFRSWISSGLIRGIL